MVRRSARFVIRSEDQLLGSLIPDQPERRVLERIVAGAITKESHKHRQRPRATLQRRSQRPTYRYGITGTSCRHCDQDLVPRTLAIAAQEVSEMLIGRDPWIHELISTR